MNVIKQVFYMIIGVSIVFADAQAQDRQSGSELRYIFQLAADQLVEYTVSGQVTEVEEKARQISRCLANMPQQHRRHIVPIYVVPRLPGGRSTGGGWYPNAEGGGANLRSWLNRRNVTGIPNSVVEEDLERNVPGIVAITHSRFNQRPAIHYLTGLHEMAHAIEAGIGDLTGEGVNFRQLAQKYRRSENVREHAAEAYSRLITRPNRLCRRDVIANSGESMAACSARVTRLLRAAPVFASVDQNWAPLQGCHNNSQLDQIASADTTSENSFSGPGRPEQEPNNDQTPGSDQSNDEPIGGDNSQQRNAPSSIANIPTGKGLFFRSRQFVRNAGNGNAVDVEHLLGSPQEFLQQLRDHGVNWIAMPRNARAPVFTDNIVEAFTPYANALISAATPIQIFVWNGGPEDHNRYETQVDQMVEGALEWSAKGIIIDPEGSFWRRPRNAANLVQKARSAASQHNLTVGYTDFAGTRRWHGSAVDHYSQVDYGMPQVYDRFETQPSTYPARKIAVWQEKFDTVIPISGLHQCEQRENSSACHNVRPKTAEQIRRLLSETSPPNNALGWWAHNFLVEGGHWNIIRDYSL